KILYLSSYIEYYHNEGKEKEIKYFRSSSLSINNPFYEYLRNKDYKVYLDYYYNMRSYNLVLNIFPINLYCEYINNKLDINKFYEFIINEYSTNEKYIDLYGYYLKLIKDGNEITKVNTIENKFYLDNINSINHEDFITKDDDNYLLDKDYKSSNIIN